MAESCLSQRFAEPIAEMALPNIFAKQVSDEVIARIDRLTPDSERQWGKMDVAQMLAHCCVAYEMVYEPEKHPQPNPSMRLMLRLFGKRVCVSERPYKKNLPTESAFIMKSDKDFEKEKARLMAYVGKTQALGPNQFDGRPFGSFGVLSKTEWSNMFYKHLDHHLKQFDV